MYTHQQYYSTLVMVIYIKSQANRHLVAICFSLAAYYTRQLTTWHTV